MSTVKNKLILKQIAKRWCKGILEVNEPVMSFEETRLSIDEINYIHEECEKIANRITNLPVNYSVNDLVDEYYE